MPNTFPSPNPSDESSLATLKNVLEGARANVVAGGVVEGVGGVGMSGTGGSPHRLPGDPALLCDLLP